MQQKGIIETPAGLIPAGSFMAKMDLFRYKCEPGYVESAVDMSGLIFPS